MGRPLVALVVFIVVVGGSDLTGSASRGSSSSASSGRIFRLFVELEVGAVAVLRVALALVAAVTIRVVLQAGSAVELAAARARVIRFGGDCGSIVASQNWQVRWAQGRRVLE